VQRAGLADNLAVAAMSGMQPAQAGICLNRQSLPFADQKQLRAAFEFPRIPELRCGTTTIQPALFNCLKRGQGE